MHLVGEVPQADGGVVARRDAEIFGGMSAQTPDSPPSVTVQQQVGRRVLLPDLDDFAVFRPHQDLTLRKTRGRGDEEDGRVMAEEEEEEEECGGLTLPLQTDRTHSTCCPVSSWKARHRFIS